MEKKQVTCFEMQKTCLQLVQSPRDQGTMSAMESHCYSFKIPKKKSIVFQKSPEALFLCSITRMVSKAGSGAVSTRCTQAFLRHFGLYLLEISKHREG